VQAFEKDDVLRENVRLGLLPLSKRNPPSRLAPIINGEPARLTLYTD